MNRMLYLSFVLLLFQAVTPCFGCDEALVGNATLSASSTLYTDTGAEEARLDSGSAWRAKNSDSEQYLEISFDSKKTITSIVTMGKQNSSEFVQEFRISYSVDGGNFTEYEDVPGNTKLFRGNNDSDSQVRNVFETAIVAQYVRINPTRWRDWISLRVELYGCKYEPERLQLDGQSFVVMDLNRRPVTSTEETLQLRFRTNHEDGLLLYSRGSQHDLLALQLVHGQLLFSIGLGGAEGVVTEVWCGSLLDDNAWHNMQISRLGRELAFMVDSVVVRQVLKGDFFRLDLNRELYIGGMANFNQDGIKVAANFSGCLENVMLNNTHIIRELKHDDENQTYSKVGQVLYECQPEHMIPVTFVTSASMLQITGSVQHSMNCSLDFRTFNSQGLLLYNKFSGEGYVKLFLDAGRIRVELQGKGTPVVLLRPFDDLLNDGRWHRLMLVLEINRIELHLDGVPSITRRLFSMETGTEYLIGGSMHSGQGFVGCMRYLHVEGRYVNVLTLKSNQVRGELQRNACHMVDRCHPNPCEHGGVCEQDHTTFACNCTDTGYTGAVCHLPLHPVSCAAYRMERKLDEQTQRVLIDVDGSGPLAPFPVECVFHSNNRTETLVHHKNEQTVDVKGYQGAGSFSQDIAYDSPLEQMMRLMNRSVQCRQRLVYECYNARLFNTSGQDSSPDSFAPFGWWVSRRNQKMDYWAGSIPGSHKCRCGLYGTCKDPKHQCNCDAGAEEWLSDGGELTDRDHLPVRQLRFGDTGSASLLKDKKRGRYILGPLECEGDALLNDMVTFHSAKATIEVPLVNLSHSWDMYFHFKTTAEYGVIMHSKGPTGFVKLTLYGDDLIQLQYKRAGGSPGAVSVKTSYKLNDNEWHSVHVECNLKQAHIIVDGGDSATMNEPPDRVQALHLPESLVIGASVDRRDGYVGCLRAFMVNGEPLQLRERAVSAPDGVAPGCTGRCSTHSCLNGGTCLEGYSGYTCDCHWTPFKGPFCGDEIGFSVRSGRYVRYDFETPLSTQEEYIRVGFATAEHYGLIFGLSSHSGDYINLMMSTRGHLILGFDYGSGPVEVVIKNKNFAHTFTHDVRIKRTNDGENMTVTVVVDNLEPIIYEYNIRDMADVQFDDLRSIYVGGNGTGKGFLGCISRVQFNDHVPLRRYFQEDPPSNVHAFPEGVVLREDTCDILPATPPEGGTQPPHQGFRLR